MNALLLSAVRTPLGKFCGMLKDIPAVELGAHAIRGAIARSGVSSKHVEEAIMGQVLQAGCGQNPARQAALKAGLPVYVNAFTVNKCCGSGLKAILLAAQAVKAGDGHLFVAGGMESMSRAPFLLPEFRMGKRLGTSDAQDAILTDGLLCASCDWHMGHAAEHSAKKHKISRRQQDAFALLSHQNAVRAQQAGLLGEEIVPVGLRRDGQDIVLDKDEGPRPATSAHALSRLSPAFQAEGGTVTAGNAPGLFDGAAAAVVCSEAYAKKAGHKPLARILDYAAVGVAPKEVFTAPAVAAMALLKKMGAGWKDFDLIEVNEAFAAACLASEKIAGWDASRVNVHGGSIAFGHPLGASGARIVATLLNALKARGKKRGMAAICMGGGNGLAMAVEIV